jgi:hypothetical protein
MTVPSKASDGASRLLSLILERHAELELTDSQLGALSRLYWDPHDSNDRSVEVISQHLSHDQFQRALVSMRAVGVHYFEIRGKKVEGASIGARYAEPQCKKPTRLRGKVAPDHDANAGSGLDLPPLSILYPRHYPTSQDGQRFARSERALLLNRLRLEVRHVALRHGKPQDDLAADLLLGACQRDVAQLTYIQELITKSIGSTTGVTLVE